MRLVRVGEVQPAQPTVAAPPVVVFWSAPFCDTPMLKYAMVDSRSRRRRETTAVSRSQ